MTVEDISKCANADRMPNESMTAPELLLWYQLRDVYSLVKSGKWTKKRGADAKETIVNYFNANRKMLEWNAALWRRIEYAAERYANDKTIENADAFFEAVYGVRPQKREER